MHSLFLSPVEADISVLASLLLAVGEYQFRKLAVLRDVKWCS